MRNGSASASALVFDEDDGEELTETLVDASGTTHEVVYRFHGPREYVAHPLDDTHQSLVVSAPVKIDGKAVDASTAPIVLANAVGAYMPSTVETAVGVGQNQLQLPGIGPAPGRRGDTGPVNGLVNLAKLALVAGYVVVEPGARGRSLVDASGNRYGTAPAAIVDLKAAVRYIRFNADRIPGNTEWIVSTGTSAGGALSALLGASGDSSLYDDHLDKIGAADASDAIFATAAWCPITDLEHADAAYEWNWGDNVTQPGGTPVDPTVSADLKSQFTEYQAGLQLDGLDGFGPLTADNYAQYLLETYLQPSATKHLKALSDADRAVYLAKNTFISWDDGRATFAWDDYLSHVGARKKPAPAFDAFDASTPENDEFGTATTGARHFTAYSATRSTAASPATSIDGDIPTLLRLMNPMHFISEKNPHRSRHWWIRLGANDTDTSLTVSANLAAAVHNIGDDVDHAYYWDQGHATNIDPNDFIAWIGEITGS
ncbi:hypothetical protein EHW97_13865 [Aeromicrobium camelliae]|uniref:BD-FAE-like domain-containing protein n=1 Tax=Aeromicrobium camelliae TaxID=1538144 RepID=A0A3N6Z5Y5_9ACTN|nr:subtype B tannase [Aeromicrobium camelliae]RQN02337.1 hypothetical protein EHW97_13865 [Aeromicrobium camelliae]